MRTFLGSLLALLLLSSCATPEPATKLEKANVLPLALNDKFQFRKQKLAFYDGQTLPLTTSEPVIFERQRMEWGAIGWMEKSEKYGNYFTFFWRTGERADVTVRLEYRQAALGNYVMAMERYYPDAKGSYKSEFTVAGDDFLEFGKVTSWRCLLIVDGKIVGLTQSFIWK